MSSTFLHIRAQKYRVFHINFQDPLLIFLVISNSVKNEYGVRTESITLAFTQAGVPVRNTKKKKNTTNKETPKSLYVFHR